MFFGTVKVSVPVVTMNSIVVDVGYLLVGWLLQVLEVRPSLAPLL